MAGEPPSYPQRSESEAGDGASRGKRRAKFAGVPPAGWGPRQVVLGVIVAILLIMVGTVVVVAFDPDLESAAANNVAQLIVALVLGGTALGFAARERVGVPGALAKLGLGRVAKAAIGMAIVAWAVYIVVAATASPLLQPEQEDVTRDLGVDRGTLAMITAGVLIVVAAPISEELFFRGFMFAGLRRSLPLWPAALLSAGIWGMLHFGPGNWGVVVQLTIFGIVLGWLYERTGTLWAPILAHTINNSLAFTLLVTQAI